jgi:hypothetical protein
MLGSGRIGALGAKIALGGAGAFFGAAAFLAGLGAAFRAGGFLRAAFFGFAFLRAAFFGFAFLRAAFFGFAFLRAAFFRAGFFRAAFFRAPFFRAGFRAVFFLVDLVRRTAILLPHSRMERRCTDSRQADSGGNVLVQYRTAEFQSCSEGGGPRLGENKKGHLFQVLTNARQEHNRTRPGSESPHPSRVPPVCRAWSRGSGANSSGPMPDASARTQGPRG